MKVKFKEILSRITGLSVPVFGIQWSPSEIEITKARRVIAFLEDRRVLYAPNELENPEHCVNSVLEIRKFLTSEIGNMDSDSELTENLRAMRAACRKFLDEVSDENERIIRNATSYGHYASWKFYGALGLMRGVFGMHIALIASKFGLDVEKNLASILPNLDEHNDKGFTKLNID